MDARKQNDGEDVFALSPETFEKLCNGIQDSMLHIATTPFDELTDTEKELLLMLAFLEGEKDLVARFTMKASFEYGKLTRFSFFPDDHDTGGGNGGNNGGKPPPLIDDKAKENIRRMLALAWIERERQRERNREHQREYRKRKRDRPTDRQKGTHTS